MFILINIIKVLNTLLMIKGWKTSWAKISQIYIVACETYSSHSYLKINASWTCKNWRMLRFDSTVRQSFFSFFFNDFATTQGRSHYEGKGYIYSTPVTRSFPIHPTCAELDFSYSLPTLPPEWPSHHFIWDLELVAVSQGRVYHRNH